MPNGREAYVPLPEASPYQHHVPALDGIRGLAVLGVMGSHLFPGTTRSFLTSVIAWFLSFGATGVDLFFVLSGFLISGILYDTRDTAHFFRTFYARRVLRIFPLYYGVLLVFWIFSVTRGVHFQHELLSFSLYLQNTSLLAKPIYAYAGPFLPLAHFWSLAIEEQFYLVWPLLLFSLRDRRRVFAFCIGIVVVCPILRFILALQGVNYFPIHTNTMLRADSLLAGGALALWFRGPRHDVALRWSYVLLVVGLLAGIALRCAAPDRNDGSILFALFMALGYTAFAVASVGLLATVFRSRAAAQVFSLRPMRWLGKYSYGLYVLHPILFPYLQPILKGFSERIYASKGVAVAFAGFGTFLASCVAAYLSYQLYERRFLRLKRFFDYRVHSGAKADRTVVAQN